MNTRPAGIQKDGFSLVEILVTLAILSVLVVLLAQIVASSSAVSQKTGRLIDADNESRTVFDRLGIDLGEMILRPDSNCYFAKDRTGDRNDELYFFSRVPGIFDSASPAGGRSPISLVGYRVNSQANSLFEHQLERLALGLRWSDPNTSSPNQLLFNPNNGTNLIETSWSSVLMPSATDFYQLLGSQTFRFEYTFLVRDTLGGPAQLTTTPPDDVSSLAAIVVGIAVLDSSSRLKDDDLSTAIAALPDAVDGRDILELWQPIVSSPGFAQESGLPVEAASAVRIYQRYLHFPTFSPTAATP